MSVTSSPSRLQRLKSGRRIPPKTEEERHDSERADEMLVEFISRWEDNLKRADNRASVVEIPGAHHYVFLNEERVVLQHIQSFLKALPR